MSICENNVAASKSQSLTHIQYSICFKKVQTQSQFLTFSKKSTSPDSIGFKKVKLKVDVKSH